MVTVESLVESDAMGQCAAERNGDGLGVRAESSCGKELGEPRSIPGDKSSQEQRWAGKRCFC